MSEKKYEEGVDPITFFREQCALEKKAINLKEILETCNERVRANPDSGESCHMEMTDYVHFLDHCAMPKAFKHLK
nr:unnamed protein product [Meloidogyne enterolobii]CAD2176795.1 unnamed protein product [Meloidogyne enterolobii]CAD2181551.1 unnamed protein product [Meloidogyne enterolobii]